MKIEDINTLQENINKVKKDIPEQATLVAVTKSVTSEVMKEMLKLGVNKFGENRIKTLIQKQDELGELSKDIQWHYIGRIQRRQVKDILPRVDYIHSLDRLSLANEIQKRAETKVKCFIQVNLSGEEQKAGFKEEDLEKVIEELETFDKIQIVGLMTMAPYQAEDSYIKELFSKLRLLRDNIKAKNLDHAPCEFLSMGMSQDYKIAIEEGATHLRIGSTLYEGLSDDLRVEY